MTAQKKGNKKSLLLTVLVIIFVIGVGVVVGVLIFRSEKTDTASVSELFKSDENGEIQEIEEPSVEDDLTEEEVAELEKKLEDEMESEPGTYEGSEAEQSVDKQVSEEDEDVLKKAVGDKGFVNRAYGYAFIPPEGWYPDQINSDISPFIYYTTFDPSEVKTASEVPGAKIEVIVQGNVKDQTLDEWIEEGHGYMDAKNTEKIKIGEHDAVKEEVDYEGSMTAVTLIKEGDVYTFALYGDEDTYAKNKDTFEEVIKSIVVL
ncbi:hypothetical protein KKH43_00145 [Patescibacteria group bacterium]|nr:hypothetical protein [Patescibacteria group bacterium]